MRASRELLPLLAHNHRVLKSPPSSNQPAIVLLFTRPLLCFLDCQPNSVNISSIAFYTSLLTKCASLFFYFPYKFTPISFPFVCIILSNTPISPTCVFNTQLPPCFVLFLCRAYHLNLDSHHNCLQSSFFFFKTLLFYVNVVQSFAPLFSRNMIHQLHSLCILILSSTWTST